MSLDPERQESNKMLELNRGNSKKRGVISSIGGGLSDIWNGAGNALDAVGEDFQGFVHGLGSIVDTAEDTVLIFDIALAVGIGLLAYGLSQSFTKSDVTNIGEGVSRVVKSSK
jgi:hypothetical protein